MQQNLIIIDDDVPFRERLSRSMEKKGFVVEAVGSTKEAKNRLKEKKFSYAIVDMRLDEGSGLEVIQFIKKNSPETQSLLLTGYGNIATAVAAIKSGAIDYLPKPADIEQIYDALILSKDILPPPPENPMTARNISVFVYGHTNLLTRNSYNEFWTGRQTLSGFLICEFGMFPFRLPDMLGHSQLIFTTSTRK